MVRTYGISRETIGQFFASESAGGFGVGPDDLSGFLEYMWSKVIPTTDDSMETGLQMFPGGDSGMNRLIVKTLIPNSIEGQQSMEAVWKNRIDFQALDWPDQPARLRLSATAVRVEHDGEPSRANHVWVTYSSGGKLYRVKGQDGRNGRRRVDHPARRARSRSGAKGSVFEIPVLAVHGR